MITMEKKEMTTIAYDHKNKTIAWDSRKTSSDNIIMNDDEGKHVERDGVHFWLAGTACDLESMIDAYFTGDAGKDLDCNVVSLRFRIRLHVRNK